jgi:hypothetical protein
VRKETVIYQSVSAIPREIPKGSHKLYGTKLAQNGTKNGPKTATELSWFSDLIVR